MGTEFRGWAELSADLQKVADEFSDNGGDLNSILKAAGKPILEQAKLNCPVRPGSGLLKKSLVIKVNQKKGGWYKARIGAMKGSDGYYATFVEYGHKGPHPAPAHPFLEPAYDLKVNEAYGIIKQQLTDKLTKL